MTRTATRDKQTVATVIGARRIFWCAAAASECAFAKDNFSKPPEEDIRRSTSPMPETPVNELRHRFAGDLLSSRRSPSSAASAGEGAEGLEPNIVRPEGR